MINHQSIIERRIEALERLVREMRGQSIETHRRVVSVSRLPDASKRFTVLKQTKTIVDFQANTQTSLGSKSLAFNWIHFVGDY